MPAPDAARADIAAKEALLVQDDRNALGDAILRAYPNLDELYYLLQTKWGVPVSNFVYVEQPGHLVVTDVVKWAHAQGKALELLSVAWTEKYSQHEPLKLLADRFFADPAIQADKYAAQRSPLKSGDTQIGSPDDVEELMQDATTGLCRIVVKGAPTATGFLIGSRTVLTTYSAVSRAIDQAMTGKDIRVVFGSDGVDQEIAAGAAGANWRGPFSSYVHAGGGDGALLGPDNLDFAVIRLKTPIIGRDIFVLPEQVPIVVPGDEVSILNHPMGKNLVRAVGQLFDYQADGMRVRYLVHTEPGSAGAPVFNAKGHLIALHHAGMFEGGTKVGQGVPICWIRAAIDQAGLDLDKL